MNFELFSEVLPYAAKGMAGIFAVTLIIIAAVYLLNFLTSDKNKKK